jgi:cellulose synthase/poly-beta-1,6-N-acetylglucosamine synthase-like glycosyltransferase
MIVLQSLHWLLLAAEICVAFPVAYLCILSIFAVINARKKASAEVCHEVSIGGHTNFAVLIPAHNEEVILHTLLENLSYLEYPKAMYTVYVVADNCTDGTAELARQFEGVCVYERNDAFKRGKGYALNWIWQELEESQLIYDAYVILDADSVVLPTFLQSMDKELVRGARALQACNTVLNVSASASTALRWIALALINHVRPLGRNAIGGSSTLTGNGMCLSRDLLVRHPWQAFGIAEDYQYYLTLIQYGEWVRYVPEAIVRSQMPTTFAQMRTQDVRWEASEPQQAQWRIALRLLSTGIRLGSFIRIEAAVELLTPPLSFLASACLLLFVATLLLWSPFEIVLSLALLGGLATYIATAFYLLHPPSMVYKALLHAPGFMFWKLWVHFVLSRSPKHTSEWVRTSRTSS